MEKLRRKKIEFGDFQTPEDLAKDIAVLVKRRNIKAKSIVEPTCGKGSILKSALANLDGWETIIGFDINKNYINALRKDVRAIAPNMDKIQIKQGDFFNINWFNLLKSLPQPVLIIGNLPWVTNSGLSVINGTNLPAKSNFLRHKGFDAISGKSNFDISEWMLMHMIDSLRGIDASIVMLCKTVVARKLLNYMWKGKSALQKAAMYKIDAKYYFQANVDACLLFLSFGKQKNSFDCEVYSNIKAVSYENVIGFHDGILVNNIKSYLRLRNLHGAVDSAWRTGVKHDSSKVMEFVRDGDYYINGFGQKYLLEDEYLYPLLKSSDVANGRIKEINRYVLVTQKFVGQETRSIKKMAPKVWKYLNKYEEILNRRKSSIYKDKPRFSIFAIGDYSFFDWKIVISGLYKKIEFKLIGRHNNKPIMVDDTCNYLSFTNKKEAELIFEMLSSKQAKDFLNSIIFWDAKRPITVNVLKKLSIFELAKETNKVDTFSLFRHREKQLSFV